MWKMKSMRDDGRVFEVKALDRSDDPDLLQVVSDARTALIEQVHDQIGVTFSSIKVPPIFSSSLHVFSQITGR